MLCILQMALIFIQEDIIGFRADFFDLLEDVGETGAAYWFLRMVEIGGYLWVPFQIAIQTALTAMLLWFGTFAFGYKASYRSLWKSAIYSYPFIFVSQILKILWFGFIDRDYEQFDLDYFHRFSPAVLVPESAYDSFIYKFLLLFNAGMILYLWFLTMAVAFSLGRSFKIAAPVVLTFIGGIGMLWKVFVWIVG